MARRRNPLPATYRRTIALGLSAFLAFPLFPQQFGIQSSFLPAIIHTPAAAGILADIGESDRVPYLTEVTRENQGASVFHPNTSDMLIQQAEEKFRSGTRFYM